MKVNVTRYYHLLKLNVVSEFDSLADWSDVV